MTAANKSPRRDETVLLRTDSGGVATLTLNRPEARNALSRDLIDALKDAIDAIAGDGAVRVVVIAANGPAFCAGHDMREMRANPDLDEYEELFAASSALMKAILGLPQPVIARVQATATAAGCQLVATCDLAVASAEATFATPGVNIGLFCSTPMVALSRNAPRKQTMEMLLTGEAMDAETARGYGLVNRVVPPEALDEAVSDLARTIISKPPMTLALGKEAFYRQLEMGISDAYAFTGKVMANNMMNREAAEGIDAFLEKRPPDWTKR